MNQETQYKRTISALENCDNEVTVTIFGEIAHRLIGEIPDVMEELFNRLIEEEIPVAKLLLTKPNREYELAEALEAYTDPNNAEYDPAFDAEIRSLRPDWFE